MAKVEKKMHYDIFENKAKEREKEMQTLDKFVEYILGSNKEPYEIKNLITYYVAVAWEYSYTQRSNDIKKMEETNEL